MLRSASWRVKAHAMPRPLALRRCCQAASSAASGVRLGRRRSRLGRSRMPISISATLSPFVGAALAALRSAWRRISRARASPRPRARAHERSRMPISISATLSPFVGAALAALRSAWRRISRARASPRPRARAHERSRMPISISAMLSPFVGAALAALRSAWRRISRARASPRPRVRAHEPAPTSPRPRARAHERSRFSACTQTYGSPYLPISWRGTA